MHLAIGALFSPKDPVTLLRSQGYLPESPPNRFLIFQLRPNTSWRAFDWGVQGRLMLKNTNGNRQVKSGSQPPKGVYFPVISQRQPQGKVVSGKDLALNSFCTPTTFLRFLPFPNICPYPSNYQTLRTDTEARSWFLSIVNLPRCTMT